MISRTLLSVLVCLSVAMVPSRVLAENWIQAIYKSALDRDPVMGRARSRHEMAREEVNIARSALLPRIDAVAGVSSIESSTHNYRPGTMEGRYQGHNYSVMLRQPIYNGASWSNLASADASSGSAEAAALNANQDLIARVAEAALTAFRYRTAAVYAAGEEQRAEELLVYAEVSLRLGAMDIINRNEIRARLDEARSIAVRSGNESKLATQDLAILAGVPAQSLKLPERLSTKLPPLGSYRSAEAWLAIAETNNPSIMQAKKELEAVTFDVDTARRGHWPTLDLNGGYAVNKGSTFLPEVETRQWSVGLNLNLSIFAGLGTSARSDRARANRVEKEFALQAVRDDVRRKVEAAFLSLDSAESIMTSVKQRLDSEKEFLSSVEQGMKYGVRARTDKLMALRRLASAERDLVYAGIEGRLAWLRLRNAAGLLSEADLVEVGQ